MRSFGLWCSIFLCVVLCGAFHCGTAQGAIYWNGGSGLGVVNLDGSKATYFWRYFMAYGKVQRGCGLALDSKHLYWADASENVIGRSGLDGTSVEWRFIEGADEPCGVAVDQSHIYWANRKGESIGRANLDGSEVVQNFIPTPGRPCGVTVHGGYLYWSSLLGHNRVSRAGLNGGNLVEELIPHGGCGVAVDGRNIFWSTFAGALGRSDLDGSDQEPMFVTGLKRSCGVASDGSRVYWTEEGEDGLPGGVGSANVDGSDVRRNIVSDPESPCGVAVDGSYWGGPAPPRPGPNFEFGRIRRNKAKGFAFIPVRFPTWGKADISVDKGLKVRFLPERAESVELESGGVKWVKIAADRSARFGRRTLRRLSRFGKSEVHFGISYDEEGKYPAWRVKRFKLVKGVRRHRRGHRRVQR